MGHRSAAGGGAGGDDVLGLHTIACVDIDVAAVSHCTLVGTLVSSQRSVAATAFAAVLAQVQRTVRADDRVCPVATSVIMVEFGSMASGVLPQILGDRLAAAVGTATRFDSADNRVAVSVGVAAQEPHQRQCEVAHRALSAARAGARHLGRRHGTDRVLPSTVVTIDRVLSPAPTARGRAEDFQSVHRRVPHCVKTERRRARGRPGATDATGSLPASAHRRPLDLTVVVVDPTSAARRGPGLAAFTAADLVLGLGCRAALTVGTVADDLVLDVDGSPVDTAVLVLDAEWGPSSAWSTGSWGGPAQMTERYQCAGITVLAVGAGAGAGAVASCVAHGARPVARLDDLGIALTASSDATGDEGHLGPEAGLSARFRALVGLTTSERRVLFYLTEGWSAQAIADELVVSLTTVRSHIRSVLRKLEVRSQLAAVAIANTRDLSTDAPVPVG